MAHALHPVDVGRCGTYLGDRNTYKLLQLQFVVWNGSCLVAGALVLSDRCGAVVIDGRRNDRKPECVLASSVFLASSSFICCSIHDA